MRLQREWPALVLASTSPTRAKLLKDAGLAFTIVPASFNEVGARRAARENGASAQEAAAILAEGKALEVSAAMPEAMVIGADQILAAGESWLEKPVGQQQAAEQLRALRGREHHLASAVAVAAAGHVRFLHTCEATLRFLSFSDSLLEAVLQADRAAIGSSVGGYRLEGPGILLCEQIQGDHFTILGLPMLPLLAFLRTTGLLIA
ncbi:MAG: Maf family protein [Acetobacteraceae bacterium]